MVTWLSTNILNIFLQFHGEKESLSSQQMILGQLGIIWAKKMTLDPISFSTQNFSYGWSYT